MVLAEEDGTKFLQVVQKIICPLLALLVMPMYALHRDTRASAECLRADTLGADGQGGRGNFSLECMVYERDNISKEPKEICMR